MKISGFHLKLNTLLRTFQRRPFGLAGIAQAAQLESRASALRTAFGWGIPTILTQRDAASPWTMVAAETCDCTLCRSVAGCWVSGLCQRSTPLMRLAHIPTALYPSHLRRRQLIHNGNVVYYTKILAQKSMGFEKWTRRAHSAEKTAAQGAAGDSPLKQAWTDHFFFYTSTLLHSSNIPSRQRGRRWSTGG